MLKKQGGSVVSLQSTSNVQSERKDFAFFAKKAQQKQELMLKEMQER
jgi:hypothetical protein